MPPLCSPASVEAVLFNALAWNSRPFITTPLPPSPMTQGDIAPRLFSLLPQECTRLFIHLFAHHSFTAHILRTYYLQNQALQTQGQTRPSALLDGLLFRNSGPYTMAQIMEDWSLICHPAGYTALGTLSPSFPSWENSRRLVGESNIMQEKTLIFSKLQKIIFKVHHLQSYI